MTNNKIFNRDFDTLLSIQQGTYTNPVVPNKPSATEADYEMLYTHGVDGLKKKGFFGILDRLGIIP